ncbi:MAG TPA: branched-chain amino acid ABC transporter permease [Candidatus Rokubacteria bacterium]|nr:branched-chain amino acid ABC transporter permease [Candidatus Rokubacteria bacterium]
MTRRAVRWLAGVAALAVLLAYPSLFGIYFTNSFVTFGIFALYAVSFNLLLGFTGLLSFGHAMFFGAGGYGTALALTHLKGLPLLPALALGVAAALALGLLLAPLMVRISGTAFAMLHLAFGQLMYVLALKLRTITGGEDGIGGFPIPPFSVPGVLSVDMKTPANFYYFAVAVLGFSVFALWFVTKTPFGCVMVGVRDNPNRVAYLGFRVPHTKAVVYLLAAGSAGVAGSVFAMFQNLVSADGALHVFVSFAPVQLTMIGGVGSFFGPILGSAIFGVISELTSRYTERVELVSGAILILVIMYAPLGVIGMWHAARARARARFAPRGAAEPAR